MTETRTVNLDITEMRTEGRRLTGYAAVFDQWTKVGATQERVAPGAFAAVLARDELDVVLNLNHDDNAVLARTTAGTLRLAEDERGLRFDADLPTSPLGDNVREAVRRGDIAGASFRFSPAGEIWDGDRRTITAVAELMDICAATRPAYAGTAVEVRTTDRRAAGKEHSMTTETTTVEAGLIAEPDPEPRAGALTVESREAPAPSSTIESRIWEAVQDVSQGEVRALSTTSTLAPGELSSFVFDKLRASSVALRAGVRILTTDKDTVTYPAITADVASGWTAEGAQITAADPTLASVTATPRKLAARVVVSNELIDDSDPSVLEVLRSHLATILALKLDLGIFEGSGTPPEITGIKNVSGISLSNVGNNGALPTDLDFVSDAIYSVEAANATPRAIFCHPRVVNTVLRKAKTGISSDKTPLLGEEILTNGITPTVFGLPVYPTAQLSITETKGTATSVCSSVYIVDTEQVFLVRRSDVVIEVDRSRLFDYDQSEIRAKLRADLVVPNAAAIARVEGLKAS
jgi:HK97 family phage major capsid protein